MPPEIISQVPRFCPLYCFLICLPTMSIPTLKCTQPSRQPHFQVWEQDWENNQNVTGTIVPPPGRTRTWTRKEYISFREKCSWRSKMSSYPTFLIIQIFFIPATPGVSFLLLTLCVMLIILKFKKTVFKQDDFLKILLILGLFYQERIEATGI